MSDGKGFVIVSFENENGAVAIVPCSWLLHDNKVLWPPAELKCQINRLVRDEVLPQLDWKMLPVRVFWKRGKYEILVFTKNRNECNGKTKPLKPHLQANDESFSCQHSHMGTWIYCYFFTFYHNCRFTKFCHLIIH